MKTSAQNIRYTFSSPTERSFSLKYWNSFIVLIEFRHVREEIAFWFECVVFGEFGVKSGACRFADGLESGIENDLPIKIIHVLNASFWGDPIAKSCVISIFEAIWSNLASLPLPQAILFHAQPQQVCANKMESTMLSLYREQWANSKQQTPPTSAPALIALEVKQNKVI